MKSKLTQKFTSEQKTKIRAIEVVSQIERLLGAAQDILHATVNISYDGLTKKQNSYIRKMIKEDGELKLKIKKHIELINAFAHGTQNNLMDKEPKR